MHTALREVGPFGHRAPHASAPAHSPPGPCPSPPSLQHRPTRPTRPSTRARQLRTVEELLQREYPSDRRLHDCLELIKAKVPLDAEAPHVRNVREELGKNSIAEVCVGCEVGCVCGMDWPSAALRAWLGAGKQAPHVAPPHAHPLLPQRLAGPTDPHLRDSLLAQLHYRVRSKVLAYRRARAQWEMLLERAADLDAIIDHVRGE